MKKFIVLHSKDCLDSTILMPFLKGLNMGEKYRFEFHDIWNDEEAKKIKESYRVILEKTGKPDAIPMFIDIEKGEALSAPNFEKFITWVEGPDWWK